MDFLSTTSQNLSLYKYKNNYKYDEIHNVKLN